MSLVMSYSTSECQLWCCDGRTIQLRNGHLEQVSNTEKKIQRIPDSNVLCGWAGEKYDAEYILQELPTRSFFSGDHILEQLADRCRKVNTLSRQYCADHGCTYCPTGLLIGGYVGESQIIYVVDPDGRIDTHRRIGAIGIGAEAVAEKSFAFQKDEVSPIEAFEFLFDCLVAASREFEHVGGGVHWFFNNST